MIQRMLARYYLLPTIGLLSLCTVVWRIYVTRLFGVIFRLFQSFPYDYQTNGARVRATGIVGILTHHLNRADSFLSDTFWSDFFLFTFRMTHCGRSQLHARQLPWAMNGQYVWLIDQVNLNTYRIKWATGLENMADYFTKHFAAAHHRDVRPFYMQLLNSPRVIRKANKKVSDKKESARLRWCVNIPTIPVTRTRAPLVW